MDLRKDRWKTHLLQDSHAKFELLVAFELELGLLAVLATLPMDAFCSSLIVIKWYRVLWLNGDEKNVVSSGGMR